MANRGCVLICKRQQARVSSIQIFPLQLWKRWGAGVLRPVAAFAELRVDSQVRSISWYHPYHDAIWLPSAVIFFFPFLIFFSLYFTFEVRSRSDFCSLELGKLNGVGQIG